MGWANDQFDGKLTIPTGATSGARIVLDGTSVPASITVYDANDNVVAQMTTNIPHTGQDDGGFYTADPNTGKVVQIFGEAILFGDQTHTLHLAPLLTWQYLTAPNPDVLRLQVVSGRAVSTHQSARLFLDSETTGARAEVSASSESVLPEDFVFTTHGEMNVRGDIVIRNVSQGRGIQDYTNRTTDTGTVTTTETVGITSANCTFVDGRAYRVIAKGIAQSSVLGDIVKIRVRRSTVAGQTFIDTLDTLRIHEAAGLTTFYDGNVFVNDTGADIVAPLVMTYFRDSGTGNVNIRATASNPAYLEITDIGLASDYPNATELT